MGRSAKSLVGMYYVRRDRGEVGKTRDQLISFAQTSPGPVAEQLLQLGLVGFDARGDYIVKPEKLKPAVATYKDRLDFIEERGVDSYLASYREELWVSDVQIKNAVNREVKAEAEAIVAAARVTKQPLTPYQRRVLQPALEGKFLDYAQSEYRSAERGRLAQRVKKRQGHYRDPSIKARAQELIEMGRESGFGVWSPYAGKSTMNPFSARAS